MFKNIDWKGLLRAIETLQSGRQGREKWEEGSGNDGRGREFATSH